MHSVLTPASDQQTCNFNPLLRCRYDYGCFSRAPFGALTLDHFLNASRVLLPNNRCQPKDQCLAATRLMFYRRTADCLLCLYTFISRNFFVMTDDPAWLEAQLVTYRQRPRDENTFNIYAFPAAANHRLPSSSATVGRCLLLW